MRRNKRGSWFRRSDGRRQAAGTLISADVISPWRVDGNRGGHNIAHRRNANGRTRETLGWACAVIQMEHIHKTYIMGDVEVHALRGISLTVTEGEFVAIMGTSGSGKSTMMNILGCLDKPTKGKYFLDGEDVSGLTKDDRADIRNRKIGFVFQGFNLLSRTSASENVELPMLYANIDAAERVKRTSDALASVGLAGRENNNPNQLSGGQQQRVAIARSLVNKPAIILADEPTGNLDSRTSIEVMAIFQKLNREQGITLIVVTHEADISQYAGRVVLFKDGKIRRDYLVEDRLDAAEELKRLPEITDDDDDEVSETEAV